MRAPWALAASLLVLLPGCIGAMQDTVDPASVGSLTDVRSRATLPFNTSAEFSYTLVHGAFDILEPLSEFVQVELPIDELGSAADGSAVVHMGIWLPDVPEGTKVPVIADIGPYYDDGDTAATVPAERLGRFLIENFVPHGYAVAQVSVFGSGESTHCMDLMGHSEQLGIDAAVTFLGEQAWSNGNVAMIGRSYDGSTPWEAATFGNEHLKTIVPISGLQGMYDLMWRNGSAETRGPIMHNVVYGTFGIDQDAGDVYTACPDYLAGPAMGAAAYATGEPIGPYWQEREFRERALANYKGSIYLIHGLQDWNVDPHVAIPSYQLYQEAGLETKAMFGQWAHMYPDRASEHENLPEGRGAEAYPENVRMDWAQDLLEWFEHYLKGTGPKPALHVEVEDNAGAWRIEETYPPRDATWVELTLADAETSGDGLVLNPGDVGGPVVEYAFAPLSDEDDVRIAGLPQFHVTVTPLGPGGQLYAQLVDGETGMHLGHAIMDLRFAAGGTSMAPVVPGMPLVAKMEFEPMDVVLPKGHGLRLLVSNTGEDYLPSAVSAPVMIEESEASVLRLPTIERAPEAFFTPPAPAAVVGDASDS